MSCPRVAELSGPGCDDEPSACCGRPGVAAGESEAIGSPEGLAALMLLVMEMNGSDEFCSAEIIVQLSQQSYVLLWCKLLRCKARTSVPPAKSPCRTGIERAAPGNSCRDKQFLPGEFCRDSKCDLMGKAASGARRANSAKVIWPRGSKPDLHATSAPNPDRTCHHPNSGVPGTKASNAAQNCER